MSTDVIMPQLGETVAEGKILTWFKVEGDEVKEGDNLFEIETDKVTMEVQSIAAGRLTGIRVKAGEVAKVGAVVAQIGGASEVAASAAAGTLTTGASGTATPASQPADAPTARSVFEEVVTPAGSFGKASGPQGVRVTPLARRLIAQNGLDLARIAETVVKAGRSRVSESDVRAALSAAPQEPVAAPAQARRPDLDDPAPALLSDDVFQLNTIRKRTGERLQQNWQTIPHIFQAIEIDFTAVEAVRGQHKQRFKTETGAALTYLPFIARAVGLAMKEFPHVNARFNGDSLTVLPEVNLGIAVDLQHNGLVVPVVRNAGDLTVPGLAKAIGRQIEKARTGKLNPDDLSGTTYSISNNGAFGTSFTTPIINAPQVAILSTDAIRLRPAVVETPQGAFVTPRLTGVVGQSFDHRAFDGAYSGAFLSRLKVVLESRDWAAEFA